MSTSRSFIALSHLSFSLPNALTSLYAKFNLLAHLSASAKAAFLEAIALSNSALSLASCSLSTLTTSYTSYNFIVADSNCSMDSFNIFLLGSII